MVDVTVFGVGGIGALIGSGALLRSGAKSASLDGGCRRARRIPAFLAPPKRRLARCLAGSRSCSRWFRA